MRVNPVVPFIAFRALQIGVASLFALILLSRFVSPSALLLAGIAGGALVSLGLSAYFVAVFSPKGIFAPNAQTRADTPDNIWLTFDDGPDPETTPAILEILRRTNRKAIFFFVGERARRFPELVQQAKRDGHRIGAHGEIHEAMLLHSPEKVRAELTRARESLETALGEPLSERLFRPPHGFLTPTLSQTIEADGWKLMLWSHDPRDYDPQMPEMLAKKILDAPPGAIVLLHEGRQTTVDALRSALAANTTRHIDPRSSL